MPPRPATLLRSTPLSPTVRHLVLQADDGPVGHRAGQWVNLHVPLDGGEDKRAYSIANAPDPADPSRFELAVTAVPDGRVSTALHALQPGAKLRFGAPEGFFTRAGHENDALLLVGTGTGLAPLRAMLQEALSPAAPQPPPPLSLLFGCRSRADILFEPELHAWAEQGALSLHVTLSRPDPDWRGLTGYVQTHLTELARASRPQVFVCGLSPMIKAVRQVLKGELGYDRRQIHSERYD